MNTTFRILWIFLLALWITDGIYGSGISYDCIVSLPAQKMTEVKDRAYRVYFKKNHAHFMRMTNTPIFRNGLSQISEEGAYNQSRWKEYDMTLRILQDSVFRAITESEKKRLSSIMSWVAIDICINEHGDVINAELISNIPLSKYLSKKTRRHVLSVVHSMKFPLFVCADKNVYVQVRYLLYKHTSSQENEDLIKWTPPLWSDFNSEIGTDKWNDIMSGKKQ